MRIYLYLAAFIFLILPGCGEKSNPVNPPDDGSLIISGHIINSHCDFKKIFTTSFPNNDSSLYVESEINSDTSFTIRIPAPSVKYLSNYTPYNRVSVINNDTILLIDSIRIADPGMKYLRFNLSYQCSARITYSLDINAAKINPFEIAKEGDYYVSYYYFDSETTILGYHKFRVVTADFIRETITEYNVNTIKGWNKLITKFKSQEADKSIYTVTNYASEQVDWIIGSSGLFQNYKLF